ncbi:MAG: ribonuclease HII, partial [Acidimicrobiaceae bacterium]|nr:ribonuclease HII [Acidimicrobiaceae bacterium]
MRSKYLRVNDSKLLSPKLRLTLDQPIKELARGYGLGFVEPAELDAIGMSKGLTLGLERALVPIRDFVDSSVLLLDGKVNFSRYLQVKTFVKGDCQSFAIASASIIAKVARDELMARESENYPWYVFEKNKGYPSPMHVSALHAVGPSQIHRRSWSFMADLPW